MPEAHPMTPVEIGMLRIYVRRADRAAPRERRSFWRPRPGRKPLYRELILRAKTAGQMNAVAHRLSTDTATTGRCGKTAWRCPILR